MYDVLWVFLGGAIGLTFYVGVNVAWYKLTDHRFNKGGDA